MNHKPTVTIDCVGLFCPQPIFQTRLQLDKLKPGDVLELLTDDPAAEEDIKAFCKKTGNELIKIKKEGNILRFLIRKKWQM